MTIGERVRAARVERGMSQSKLAEELGLDQSAVSRIESGSRQVATHELFDLAEVLATTTGALLGQDEGTPALLLAARLEETVGDDEATGAVARVRQILEAADTLSRLVGQREDSEHPQLGLPPNATPVQQGKLLARQARELFGLGQTAPVADLASLLEQAVGVHVAHEPLDDKVSGLCATIPGAAVVLINSGHTRGRQRWTMAHELAHLLTGDLRTDLEITRAGAKSNPERRADSFAAHFLLPDEAVNTIVGDREVTTDLVGEIVHRFGMSLEAVSWRLLNCNRISRSQREKLTSRGLRGVSHDAGLLDELTRARGHEDVQQPPQRLAAAVVEAYRSRKVGLGLVADVYGTDDLDGLQRRLAPVLGRDRARSRAAAATLA